MKNAVCLLLSLILLGLSSPPVAAADTIYKKLNLATQIPQTVDSSTIVVDLQPSNYSADYKKWKTIVSVCSKPGQLCGNWEITEYPDPNPIKLNVDADYRAPNVYVLGVKENRIVFSFEKVGKYNVHIVKRWSREIKSSDPSFRGNVNTEWTHETIEFPVEITNISKGGIDIRDLAEAGIKINPYPILKCPEKIKNVKQTISCDLTYGYQDPAYFVLYEPFERFKICAYKNAGDILDCKLKNSYLNKEIRIELNQVEKINIPIFKDVDTHIELVPIISGNFPQYMDALGSQHYFFKPVKKSTPLKSRSNSGKWVKECIDIVTRTDGRFEIIDGRIQGGPVTSKSKACKYVWTP
jgi:hypothetical protein